MVWKFLCLCSLVLCYWNSTNAQSTIVQFRTQYGSFKVMLYDVTTMHKALFLQEIQKGTYRKALFNRIVKDFVVQGGEHDDEIAKREQHTGISEGRLAAEIHPDAFHKIGALGAGRDDNPEKASFLQQIYFVVGRSYTADQFDSLAIKYNKTFSPERREYYLKNGGQPQLDGDYTVFGEVTEGLDVILKISYLPVKRNSHYPKRKIRFTATVLQRSN